MKIDEQAIQIKAQTLRQQYWWEIPNAIGYLSLGTALDLKENGMPIKILRLDNVDATSEMQSTVHTNFARTKCRLSSVIKQ
ncbi:hypothetical protein KHA80_20365 [Anaerobacillus sp. HL2]|nr:hypothetical protein KHA80_20365 [Anaerobacillus sp. HL2]